MGEALRDGHGGVEMGLLDDIAKDLPALEQAQLISERAVAAGFEWDTVADVWDKVSEEVEEFHATQPGTVERKDELGDVFFTLVNVARKETIDAEEALRGTCDKFRRRWAIMERCARSDLGCKIEEASHEQLEQLWSKAKVELSDDSPVLAD
jgi:tetrapyrrole methylase family protein/MazG family protein